MPKQATSKEQNTRNRYFVSKSGRQYFQTPGGVLHAYDREKDSWAVSKRSLDEVAQEGRLYEVPSPEDFIFYARKAYERFQAEQLNTGGQENE